MSEIAPEYTRQSDSVGPFEAALGNISPPLAAASVGGPALVGDSAALFADVRRKYQGAIPGTRYTADWFRLSEVLDHAEANLRRLTTEAAAAGEANEALEAAVRSALLEQSVWLEGTRKLKADLAAARAEAAEADLQLALANTSNEQLRQLLASCERALEHRNARVEAEQSAAAEAEREKLQLHEELRGLRADVQDMNRQIGEAHRVTGEWIAECGKRTEGRKAAEQALQDARESLLAGLKEAYGQGDWLNIHHIINDLKEELAAPLLHRGTEEGEGVDNA